MSRMIQLRHVPDELHRKLKARAALEGLTLSDYLLQEARRAAERSTLAELNQRPAQRSSVTPRVSPARAIRAERERRWSSSTVLLTMVAALTCPSWRPIMDT